MQETRREMKVAKQRWIVEECEDIENSLSNTRKAFQLVKDLTGGKISQSEHLSG